MIPSMLHNVLYAQAAAQSCLSVARRDVARRDAAISVLILRIESALIVISTKSLRMIVQPLKPSIH